MMRGQRQGRDHQSGAGGQENEFGLHADASGQF
jgi:hypothetical protein